MNTDTRGFIFLSACLLIWACDVQRGTSGSGVKGDVVDSVYRNLTSRAEPLTSYEKKPTGECEYFIKNYEVNLIWLTKDSVYKFKEASSKGFLYADFIHYLNEREDAPYGMVLSCKEDYPNDLLVKVLSTISTMEIKYYLIPEEDFKVCLNSW
jgi:hypothetical protein